MTDRKKPGVAFWATVGVIVVVLLYGLGFGPAMGYCEHSDGRICDALVLFYQPIILINTYGPQPIQDLLDFYCDLWGG